MLTALVPWSCEVMWSYVTTVTILAGLPGTLSLSLPDFTSQVEVEGRYLLAVQCGVKLADNFIMWDLEI